VAAAAAVKKVKALLQLQRLRYPIQKVTEIYKKVISVYYKVTELENSSWNVLSLLRSKVLYIGTGHILP
jgi:hypothetical protein